jgi:XTP/dITP diphosphohydrolase
MAKLLVATGNEGKLVEIIDLLSAIEVEIIKPSDLALVLHIEEVGETYAENAAKKALTFARAAGMLALADDSGLEVAALAGAPGLFSARYAPQERATDADRRAYLLQQLRGHPRPWKAKFHCTVALATPDDEIQFAEGSCLGEIIPEERGKGGFGYDPIFLVQGIGKTMAELSLTEKNRVSHRAQAVKSAIPLLESVLQYYLKTS